MGNKTTSCWVPKPVLNCRHSKEVVFCSTLPRWSEATYVGSGWAVLGGGNRSQQGSRCCLNLLLSPTPAAALEPSPWLAEPHFQHWVWRLWVNILIKVIHFYMSTSFQKVGCKLPRSCTDGWSNSHAHLETLGLSHRISGWLAPDLQSSPLRFPHVTRDVQARHLCS